MSLVNNWLLKGIKRLFRIDRRGISQVKAHSYLFDVTPLKHTCVKLCSLFSYSSMEIFFSYSSMESFRELNITMKALLL